MPLHVKYICAVFFHQIEAVHEKLKHLTADSWNSEEAAKPAYNSQELEDCDIATGEGLLLMRLGGDSHKPTHMVLEFVM